MAVTAMSKPDHVAPDGTKMKVNASRHNAMSYGRMLRAEKELRKEARSFGHFLLRGLERVRGEWALLMTTHNVLMLYGARLR